MENFREDYLSRLQSTSHGIAQALFADILLLVVVVGMALALNSVVT